MNVALTVVEPACPEETSSGGETSRSGEIDSATLEGCRRRDPAALRRFVVQYQRTVFAFLSRSVGSGPHIEDLAQEVFLRAHRGLPRFDPSGPARMSTWLLTIARRVATDARRVRTIRLAPLDESMLVDPSTPETERRRGEIAREFEKAASQLTDDQRDAFVLAQFHGLSMAEIGEVLGVPENTVRTRLFRARERLRALLCEVREA